MISKIEDMVPSTRVFLWTAPRCHSSIFERSVRELDKVKVLYEPHQNPYHCSIGRGHEYKLEQTYDSADEQLLSDYADYTAMFAKNMAYFIPKNRYSCYVEGPFLTFKHTFLIRNPCESQPSRWKACTKCGFSFPGEIDSYLGLYEMFQFIQSTGREVTVIDSTTLLEDPEHVMQQYCTQTGLPYDKKMLTWSPGVVEDWTKFKYYKEWHWNAMYSSGFNLGVKRSINIDSFPSAVEKEIEKAMPYYQALYKHCVANAS